jgi:OCT family organic cation transporter-like MFS transporter 4/5
LPLPFLAVCLSIVGIYNAELFPTTIRSTIMGLHGQFSRLGCITAPFLLMAGQQTASSTVGPFLVFGSLALVGGLLMLTMPETRGTAMPETMEVGPERPPSTT